jgi:hypothetical protein
MAACNKGFEGCPGKVPLTSKQCKGHRFYGRMKSKMEAAMGEGEENSWVKAVNNMKRVRQSQCLKECCSLEWLPSQQVTKAVASGGYQNIQFKLQVVFLRNCEPVTPGLKGFKPEVLQTPQPLSKPGGWEAVITGGPCTNHCCVSTKLVIKLHEQVAILE